MISHEDILLAMRAKLATLSVIASSGDFTVTSSGFTRATGSFVTDGFAPGMVVTGSGFATSANNDEFQINVVSATQLTVDDATAEAETSATLTVASPTVVSENVRYTPTSGLSYFEEQYLPGPLAQVGLGQLAELEAQPSYVLRLFVPSHTASKALRKYVDALLSLFAPGTPITVTDHTVTVRRDVAPFASQVLQLDGWAFVTLTVPLRARTANSI